MAEIEGFQQITDVFSITVPVYRPAEVTVTPPDSFHVGYNQIFYVNFTYKLGVPKLDANTPFWCVFRSHDPRVERDIGVPTVLHINPNAPRHLTPDNRYVRPNDSQPGVVTARAPRAPLENPPPWWSGSLTVSYYATVNAWQPNE